MADFMGKEAYRQDVVAHDLIAKLPGQTMVTLAPSELERWHARLEPLTEQWVQKTPDGEKVLAAYRAEVKKLRGGS